jgi:hypothetical protein
VNSDGSQSRQSWRATIILKFLELYLHSPTCPHGIVLNYIIKYKDNFTFTFAMDKNKPSNKQYATIKNVKKNYFTKIIKSGEVS